MGNLLPVSKRTPKKPTQIKGPLLVLRQFLTTESPLKMVKNAFHFMLIAFFIFEIYKFLP